MPPAQRRPCARAALYASVMVLLFTPRLASAQESDGSAGRERVERPAAIEPSTATRATPEPPAPLQPQDPKETRKHIYLGGGITLAIGIGFLANALYIAVSARQLYDDALPSCENQEPPWGCSPSAVIDINQAQTDGLGASFGLGAGAVLSLTGTLLLSLAHLAPLDIAVGPTSDGAWLGVKGEF